jgi:hypothetical protein
MGASPLSAVRASAVSHVFKLRGDTDVHAAVTQPTPVIGCRRCAAAAHAESSRRAAVISASTSVRCTAKVASQRSLRAHTSGMTLGYCRRA